MTLAARTPLIQNVFDGNQRVFRVEDSTVLQGHFDCTLSIVPLVALKAHSLLDSQQPTRGTKIHTEITSAILPGSPVSDLKNALKIQMDNMLRRDPEIIIPLPSSLAQEGKHSSLYIPQNGVFRLADYGEISSEGGISGCYKVQNNFPWHNNDGEMDPFILEEIAAQILTYGYSARANIQAREIEGGELNKSFPLLTFKTSEVTYHTSDMPSIQNNPELVLSGKILMDEKREAKIVYTLYVRHKEGNILPLISGEIVGNKATIALMKRAVKS